MAFLVLDDLWQLYHSLAFNHRSAANQRWRTGALKPSPALYFFSFNVPFHSEIRDNTGVIRNFGFTQNLTVIKITLSH